MKLRTERSIVFGDANNPVVHDAMAAHALMQAMDEHGPEGYVYEVLERADEILAGWTGAGE